MTVELELTVRKEKSDDVGYVASFAITDQLLVAAGGTSSRRPFVFASSDARHFEPLKTPRELGLRDILAVGDALWVCGEYGQLACSRDQGATWKLFDTGTNACLFALALGHDGAVWVVGDEGYAGRVLGDRTSRLDFGTSLRLAAVYAVKEEIVVLGGDGNVYRWREGVITAAATGATKPLTGLAITKHGTWVLTGDGGFIARSPDGAWFSRVKSGVDVDLECVATLADGRVIAVGDRGSVLISSDDGRTWHAHATDHTAHLWSVERFGAGALIGGDDGLVLELAPRGTATWSDRVNVFGGAKPLDVVFAAGPEGFIGKGLSEYVAAMPGEGEAMEDRDFDDREDREAFELLAEPGDAGSFERNYGVPLPAEVKRLRETGRGLGVFDELTLEQCLLPDVGSHNLFELLVRRDQHAFLGTGLVEAFCGVFCLGSQGNGDTYHVELYEWDGPRQVLHHDHETRAFTGVLADSLDSLVYLAALARAKDAGKLSDEAHAHALRKLHGKVAPTWHFSIDDDEFQRLDPRRRDTEFFFYRARWIVALLKNDGVTEIADIPRLFNADFNQVVPEEQLPARFEACEKFIPTALYSMWRAFLFDEPELARYLDIGRRHRSRLVRDAARLIDELREGRNELGTIKDVRAHLAAFRALDLDPRRAEARKAEGVAKAKAEASRKEEAAAELERTHKTAWADLAWRWLDDGVAHRALLAKLDQTDLAAQLAALDELREMGDDDREVAVPALARELSQELEAVLVGSLVRNDRLEDALPDGGAKDGGSLDESPGWDAIDRALEPLYGDGEPHAHYGAVVPYMLGGNDPLHGISVYLRGEPQPHFHFITYGFTDLFVKETGDPEESGFGFELSLRLRRAPDDTEVPTWALNFLQNLARYVFGTGNRFDAGHKMGLNGPIALGYDTRLSAILFAEDPELGAIDSPFGKARFLEVVGITDDEYRLIQEWSTTGLVEILKKKLPYLITDLTRPSVLDDPEIEREAHERVEAEGSSEDLTFAGEMVLTTDDGHVRIEMGALYAAALPRAMRGRLRHGRGYTLRGRDATLALEPGLVAAYRREDDELVLTLPRELVVEIEATLRTGLAGTYRFTAWPALEIVVTPSIIRDQEGKAVEVRGVADPDEAEVLVDDENARLAAEEADEDDDDDVPDDDEPDPDELPPPDRLSVAIGMTERALRLSPDDEDVQFTHAMLLLDAERAGVGGQVEALLALMPAFAPSVRLNIATRMGKQGHVRFAEVCDRVLGDVVPTRVLAAGSASMFASFGDVGPELFSDLGEAILEHAPDRLARLAPLLPDDVNLLSELAWKAIQAEHPAQATAIYERLLELPIPGRGDERTNYLRALNNACVQAHAGKAYELAARIADRAQPVANENPYIYHSAACAYAAVGDYAKAFEQVKLAVAHEYDHLHKVEVDRDLGPILEWPEFKALFQDWRARQEGN